MPYTLLVADESLTIQRLVHLTFAAHDVHVVGLSDGRQAMDYLASARPDIALLSVTLPQVDGFEVARHIGREPRLHGVSVLLLAGAFDQVDDARVRDVGAAGVFVKPFEPDHVINRVKELLGITKPREEAPAAQSFARLAPPPPRPTRVETAALHLGEESLPEDTEATPPGASGASGASGAAGARGATGLFAVAPSGAELDATSAPGATGAEGARGASGARVNAGNGGAGPPLSSRSPRDAESAVEPVFDVPEPRRAEPGPTGPVAPVFGPADAFAALLAEEQGEPVAPVVTQPIVELSDAMVDRIADRVAERMMHSVFGESLRGTVHEVSERLVREEIQRIRSAHSRS